MDHDVFDDLAEDGASLLRVKARPRALQHASVELGSIDNMYDPHQTITFIGESASGSSPFDVSELT